MIYCQCGKRMTCLETRPADKGVRRRYKCDCGKRATTQETVIAFDAAPLAGGNPGAARATQPATGKHTTRSAA
jgi:hypothetical protein